MYQTIMIKHLKNDEGSLDINMVCTIIQRVVDDPRIGLDPETNDYTFLYNLAGKCRRAAASVALRQWVPSS